MRKFYLLLTLGLFLQNLKAQDVAGFNFTIGANNLVSFTNTTVLDGAGERRAHWFFGDGTHQLSPALGNTQHQYLASGVYNVCLKIIKYTNTDSIVTSDICKTITLQNTQQDLCSVSFTDTFPTTSALTQLFVAQPWHSNN